MCMHAGAETDPSDTINEIIFSTRKVCPLYYLWRCASNAESAAGQPLASGYYAHACASAPLGSIH